VPLSLDVSPGGTTRTLQSVARGGHAANMFPTKMPGIFKDVMDRRGGNITKDELWKWMTKHQHGTAKRCTIITDEDKLAKLIDTAVGQFKVAVKDGYKAAAAPKRAAQNTKAKPNAVSTPDYRSTVHVAQPDAFRMPNGCNAPQVEFDDYAQDACGIILGMVKPTLHKIMALKGNFTPQPLAFIVKCELEQLSAADEHGHLYGRYRCTEIDVAIARKAGEVHVTTKSIMINVGVEDIVYKANNLVLQRTVQLYTTMSYRVVKQCVDDTVYAGLNSPAAFKAHVHKTIDKTWLYPHMIPKPTATRKEEWKSGEIDIQMGAIHVLNDKVEEVKRRSGRNGAFIYNWERDESTSILPLPRSFTLKQAVDTTDKLATLSRGVITTKMGVCCADTQRRGHIYESQSTDRSQAC